MYDFSSHNPGYMKRFALFAAVLLLIGQGCVSAPQEEESSRDSMMLDPMEMHEDMMVEDEALMEGGDEAMEEGEAMEKVSDSGIPPKVVEMRTGNFFFEPSSIAVELGQEVMITIAENTGTHTFVIDELGINEEINEGETFSFTPTEDGTFEFYCDVGNHREMGMEGTLHVKEL